MESVQLLHRGTWGIALGTVCADKGHTLYNVSDHLVSQGVFFYFFSFLFFKH